MCETPRSRATSILALVLIVTAFGGLTYRPDLGWWVSLLGTAALLVLSVFAWPGNWKAYVGFEVPGKEVAFSILLFLVCVAVSYVLIDRSARAHGLAFLPMFETGDFGFRFLHTFGQTVNEEIVLGALLLFGVSRLFRNIRPITLSIGVALIFASLHLAFYACRPEADPNYGLLSIPALVSIFLAGVLRNNLILGCRHIGYSWALHLAWNSVFFNSTFRFPGRRIRLNEPERFNVLFDDPATLIVVGAASIASIWIFRRTLCRRPAAIP